MLTHNYGRSSGKFRHNNHNKVFHARKKYALNEINRPCWHVKKEKAFIEAGRYKNLIPIHKEMKIPSLKKVEKS